MELAGFMAHASESLRKNGSADFLAIERGFRDAALRDGSKAFLEFLSGMPDDLIVRCPACGRRMKRVDGRPKNIVSLMGSGEMTRSYYECGDGGCGAHHIPQDRKLGIEGTSFTAGVRNSVSKLSSVEPFEWSSGVLAEIAGIYVSAKECQRIAEGRGEEIETAFSKFKEHTLREKTAATRLEDMSDPPEKTINTMYIEYDGTGVPMAKSELAGRKGKQPDGSAKTREAKLGCVFTQTTVDKDGRPVRDNATTSYFGAIETAEEFGGRLYANAVVREAEKAKRVVVLGDGAKWIWNLAQQNFPEATEIVDLFHAKEHVFDIITDLCPKAEGQNELKEAWYALLEAGDIDAFAKAVQTYATYATYAKAEGKDMENIERKLNYFRENAHRMRYAEFKEQGLFVGSGVIEAGCKTVIGSRLKRSGMHWSKDGANAIIALRCNELSAKLKIPKLKAA